MIFYCYCHIGILTGPYFKYITYRDWLYSKYAQNCSTSFRFMYKRSKYTLILLVGFLALSNLVSFNDPNKDDFYENPLWYRILYMPIIFTLFRFRFYLAWIFSEYSCISSDFGAYPVESKPKPGAGPTCLDELTKPSQNSEINFKTVIIYL